MLPNHFAQYGLIVDAPAIFAGHAPGGPLLHDLATAPRNPDAALYHGFAVF